MGKGIAERTSVRIPDELHEAYRHPEYVGLSRRASKSKVLERILLKGWRSFQEERLARAELAVYEAYARDPEAAAAGVAMQRMTLRSGVV